MTLISQKEVDSYLQNIQAGLKAGKYRLDNRREKNSMFFETYVFTTDEAIDLCCTLRADDFVSCVQNEHPGYEHEVLYIFGKNLNLVKRFGNGEKLVKLYIKFNLLEDGFVIIISFHEQEHPLKYYKDSHPEYLLNLN